MKELFLFRHAKTLRAEPGMRDNQRSLSGSGHDAAIQIGEDLADDNRVPEVILASDAVRTIQTAELAADAMDLEDIVVPFSGLYAAGVEEILELLSSREENRIMIVGHNPCIEETVEHLLGDLHHMRPGSCMWLRFDIRSWDDLYGHPDVSAHKMYKAREDERD